MSHVLATAAEVIGAVVAIAAAIPTGGTSLLAYGLAVSTATATAIALATTVAVGLITQLSIKKPPTLTSPMSWQSDPLAGIPYAMGRTYSGGQLVYRQTFGKDNVNETLNTVYSSGPIQSFDTLYVDGVATAVTASGQAQIHDVGKMYVGTQRGFQPEGQQLAGTNNPGITAASKLSGLAAATVTLSYDSKGGHTLTTEPQIGWVLHGVTVYDPRQDATYPGGAGNQRAGDETTWTWSDNPGLHALTWLIGRRQNGKLMMGVGAPLAGIIVAQFVELANVCDANGWKIGGTMLSTDDKWDRFGDILQAGGAEPMWLGAQIGCNIFAPKVSLATVTSSDIIGDGSVQATQARRDRINAIVPRYMAEQSVTTGNTDGSLTTTVTWGMVAAGPVVVQDYVTFDGGTRQKQADYPFVQGVISGNNAPSQVAQLARYEIENAREFGPIALPLKLRWMGYKPGDCLTVNAPELGLVNQDVLVRQRSLSPQTATVTLTCRSETRAKHAYALGQTTTAPATPSVSGAALVSTPAATEWALTATTIANGGRTVPALVVTGAADTSGIDAIIYELRVATGTQGDDDDWQAAGIEAPATTSKPITSVIAGAVYQVSVRYRRGPRLGGRLILGPQTAGPDSASDQAAAALSVINIIASSGYLSRDKKPAVIADWGAIYNEAAPLDAQADAQGVDRTAFDNARNDLGGMLTSITPAWDDVTQDSAIVPATFRGKFTDYYFAKTSLIAALANAAAQSIPTVNRVKLSQFEAGTRGWATRYNSAGLAVSGVRSATQNGQAYFGAYFAATAAGQYVSLGTSYDTRYWIPVNGGERLAVSAWVSGYGPIANRSIAAFFADGSGAGVGGGAVATVTTAGHYADPDSLIGGFVTVPATATRMIIEAGVTSSGAGNLDMTIAKPMVCAVSSAQVALPVFVAGPNADDGADVTGLNTASDVYNVAGTPSATVLASITAANGLANTANATAAIGAQLAADVADNNKFSSTEKKRWVEKINALDASVQAEITQASTLGLAIASYNLGVKYGALKDYLVSVGYADVGHTSSIDSGTFKAKVKDFTDALTLVANAARAYAQTLSIQTSANIWTDPSFSRLPADGTTSGEYAQVTLGNGSHVEASGDGQRLRFQGGSDPSYVKTSAIPVSAGDRIDVQADAYLGGTSGGYMHHWAEFLDGNGTVITPSTLLTDFTGLPQNVWNLNVPGSVIAPSNAAWCRLWADASFASGTFFYRNPRGTKVPTALQNVGANGRQKSALLTTAFAINASAQLNGLSVGGDNASVTVSNFSMDFGDGYTNITGTTITGLAASTRYYIFLLAPNLSDAGRSFSLTTNFAGNTDRNRVLLGTYTTAAASGSTGTGGGGGGTTREPCVVETMFLVDGTRAGDARRGTPIELLKPDWSGAELGEVDDSSRWWTECVEIVTTLGAVVECSTSTPIELPDGSTIYAPDAMGVPIGVMLNERFVLDEVISVRAIGERWVARIHVGGRIYAAGREHRARVFTHNPLKP